MWHVCAVDDDALEWTTLARDPEQRAAPMTSARERGRGVWSREGCERELEWQEVVEATASGAAWGGCLW